MALPMLALGLGILGGAHYLKDREDRRNRESLLTDEIKRRREMPDEFNQQAVSLLEDELTKEDSFFDLGGTDRARASIESLRQSEDAMLAEQAAMKDAYSETNISIARDMQTRYNTQLNEFAEVQTQFRAAMQALENPSNLNSITTLYNLFNILEPGGRVTQNEDGTFTGLGDAGDRFANLLNEWQGKGLTPSARKEITESLWQQYSGRLERARNVKAYYEDEMTALGNAGRSVRTPVGSLGIDWGINQLPDPVAPQSNLVIGADGDEYEVL